MRQDVFSAAGARAIERAVRSLGRLPRSVRELRLITAAAWDAHGDHRAAHEAARRGGLALAARGVAVRLTTFIVHDEIEQPDPPLCCIGDFHWPGPGATHGRSLLVDTPVRPRPPQWTLVEPAAGTIRGDALARHVSQVSGWPALCMHTFLPGFYANWAAKQEEPFWEEAL